jgi:hypothetical protein
MACHSEGVTRSQSKSKYIKVKQDLPKAKTTEESLVKPAGKISFDSMQQKNRQWLWKRKILRRPITICQTIKFVAGLLRMTNFNTGSAL